MRIVPSRLRQAGLSLIELMIAMVIGLLLVLGLVQVFSASRTAYQLSTGVARVQENGRFAMDILQRDIRMAGHSGCVNDQARFLPGNDIPSHPSLANSFLLPADQSNSNYGNVDDRLRFDVQIQGYDAKVGGNGVATGASATITVPEAPVTAANANSWQPALPGNIFGALPAGTTPGRPVQNSDVLVLRYFDPDGVPVTGVAPGNPMTVSFDKAQAGRLTQGLTNPGLFALSDCQNAAVFQASTTDLTGTGTGSVQLTSAKKGRNNSFLVQNLSFGIGQAKLYRAESEIYYVGINPNGNPSLYRKRFLLNPGAADFAASDPEELVEGVESLQLQFGQDSITDSTQLPTGNIGSSVLANAVKPAADPATAWRRVGLVQLGLLSRSPDRAAAQQRTADSPSGQLKVLGVTVAAPNDGRYRNVYETSVALRNRLFGN